jgi:hypothetical protein
VHLRSPFSASSSIALKRSLTAHSWAAASPDGFTRICSASAGLPFCNGPCTSAAPMRNGSGQ